MNFREFIEKDLEKFRELKLGLVKNNSDCDELVHKIEEGFGLELIKLKEILNSELNNSYRGKFKFDFCLKEDININELRVKVQDRKKRIKEKWFKVLDELAKSKTEVERKLIK